MKTRFLLAGFAALGYGLAWADAPSKPVRAFLCDSAAHAILFADRRAVGESEEMAKYRVDRLASVDACGLYTGRATIESVAVSVFGGVAYRVTSYRFVEDHRIAWRAETNFAPADGSRTL